MTDRSNPPAPAWSGEKQASPDRKAPADKKAWPVLPSLQAYRPAFLSHDLFAGLTLAAIAVPEQMATARLGGFAPQLWPFRTSRTDPETGHSFGCRRGARRMTASGTLPFRGPKLPI